MSVLSVGTPLVDSVVPTDIELNTSGAFAINGANFKAGASVFIGTGAAFKSFPATFVSTGTLTFNLSSADTASLGANIFYVFVQNPDGKKSNALYNFIVYIPYILSLQPNNLTTNVPATLAFNGLYFKPGAKIYIESTSFTPATNTGTQLTLPLTSAQILALGIGTKNAYVENPALGKSNTVQLSVNAPDIAPPTNLVAASDNVSTITLTWTDNATNETGYLVERSTDNVVFVPIKNDLPVGTVTYGDTGLGNGTYYYRVAAFNGTSTSAYSNTDSGIIGSSGEPAPQDDVIEMSVGGNAVSSIPETGGETITFTVKRKQSSASGYENAKTLGVASICRLDDTDPLKSQACQNADYAGVLDLFFVTNLPETKDTYLNQVSYNFNSDYPASFDSVEKKELNTVIADDTEHLLQYIVVPSALGLVPGTYRVLGLVLPAKYDYDPAGNGIIPSIESDTSNNFSSLSFTVTSESSLAPPESPASGNPSGSASGSPGGPPGSPNASQDQPNNATPQNCVAGAESCNAIDDDCDGLTDEENVCGATSTCAPNPEVCDGTDNDCDAQVDEGCPGVFINACANNVKDNGEEGIDCGGTCGKACPTPLPFFEKIPDYVYLFVFFILGGAGLVGMLLKFYYSREAEI